MNDRLTLKGHVTIRNADTGEIITENDNMVVGLGRQAILGLMAGTVTDGVSYIALGTSSTAPNDNDIKLGAEACRSQMIEKTVSGDQLIMSAFFNGGASGVASVFQEAGIFGGNATGTADSGTLYCHTLISFDNQSAQNITATWTLTLASA